VDGTIVLSTDVEYTRFLHSIKAHFKTYADDRFKSEEKIRKKNRTVETLRARG